MNFAWMAWTTPTALFFAGLAVLLAVMGWRHVRNPRNPARVGALGLPLQRGDRLFLSLLGAAFIHLAWIGLAPQTAALWGASALSVVYAGLVFRFA
jgi:predicted small integral membrane protein